jgi:poly(A) polymerase
MKERLLRESKILRAVRRLSQRNRQKVYLVGGTVRDLFLERPLGKDFDFVAAGEVSNLAKELAATTGGHAFSLSDSFGAWRVALKSGKKKIDVDLSPMQGADILEDLRQRDFTVNSIGISLEEIFAHEHPSPIDPLHGLSDLQHRVLRANSEESLVRDPLRMLRAFRLIHTLGLKVEESTLRLIQKNKKLILNSAWERIRSEFFAGLGEMGAGRFLRDLHESGLLEVIFPEVQGWESFEQGTHHSLLEHAVRTVEAWEIIFAHLRELYPSYASLLDHHFSSIIEEGISREALFKFVAFLHDSGKPGTGSLIPGGQFVRFLDHDQEGQRINLLIAQRMKLSRKSVRIISELTRQHMRILSLAKSDEVTSRAKYRFFRDLGKEGIEAIFLALADGLASKPIRLGWPLDPELPDEQRKIKEVAGELLRYYYEEFSQQPPLLDGREVMEALGLPSGEEVGRLLNRLREAEIAGRVRTREEALEFLKNLDSSRPFGYDKF